MKKLFIIGGILIAVSAANVFANSQPFLTTGNTQAIAADTTPKKKDTLTQRRKDTMQPASYAIARLDTVPKSDTSSKKRTDSLARASVAVK